MLPRKLARDRIEISYALDGDEKGLVIRKTLPRERGHLTAQVVFQFRDIRIKNRRAAAQICAPLRDLIFQRRQRGNTAHAKLVFDQMPRNVSSTTRHCCRWSANWA